MGQSAIEIYQDFLDRMSEALIARNSSTFLDGILLPHTIQTETSKIELGSIEEVRKHFLCFSDALAAQNIDAYVRVAQEATFLTDTRIAGVHESFMTSNGKLAVPKFKNRMELEHRDGAWGCNKSHHLTRYVAWPDILPRPNKG